jgi:hypothetical protein
MPDGWGEQKHMDVFEPRPSTALRRRYHEFLAMMPAV